MKKILALGAVAMTLSGCYKIDYTYGGTPSGVPQYDEWYHIGIFALVEFSDPVPLNPICPSGFSAVHHELSFVNSLIPMATSLFGLSWVYQPHEVKVYCQSGAAYILGVDEEGLAVNAKANLDEWAAPEDFVPEWLPEVE